MFKAPIQLLNNCNKLSSQTINDLQLDVLYNDILGDEKSSRVRNIWKTNYTTDIVFLKDTQKLVNGSHQLTNNPVTDIEKLWASYNDNLGFRDN